MKTLKVQTTLLFDKMQILQKRSICKHQQYRICLNPVIFTCYIVLRKKDLKRNNKK